MNKTFVQSMKTIAESVTHNAGFDKTRSGKVVGKNTLTNTYSVRIDGNTYPNVRVVNDATYNVGDTVKVNMPCNQPSQMVIVASIFSDASLGKKIGHAQSLIDAMDAQLEDVKDIDGHIYQLNINSTYTPTSSTHTGQILKDGIDVTSATYYNKFRWYLMKATGKSQITTGISGATLSMQLADYMYGMALVLEWIDNNDGILLRKQIVLFDNAIIEREMRKVENTATQAKSIADNTAQYFWTSSDNDTGFHITEVEKDSFLANPNGYNLLSKSTGVAVRNATDEMAIFTDTGTYFNGYLNGVWQQIAAYTTTYIQIGSTMPNQRNLRIDTNGMVLKNGTYKMAEYTLGGMHLYDGTYNAYKLASFDTSGMTLRDTSNQLMCQVNKNGMTIYQEAELIANFTNTVKIGKKDDYAVLIEPSSFNLLKGNINLFNIAPSGNPTSDSYQFTEIVSSSFVRSYNLSNTPVTGNTIQCSYICDAKNAGAPITGGTITFIAGTYATKTQTVRGTTVTVTYSSPKKFVISTNYEGAGNLGFQSFTYFVSNSSSIDLGKFTFGSRRSGTIGNNTTTLGNNLLASYNYQTVVGKYNTAENKAFIVGVGTSTTLSNGFTVDWNGKIWAKNYYPVGSCFITNTNTNPSSILGFGTWQLKHKVLESYAGTSSNGNDGSIGNYIGNITWNNTNTIRYVTSGSTTNYRTATIVIRNGEMFLRIVWYNKVAPSDDTIEICSIYFPQFSSTPYGLRSAGVADGLNSIPIAGISWSGNDTMGIIGTIHVYDFVHSGTSYSTKTGETCWVEFRLAYTDSQIRDNYCNEFHWIRVS